MSNHIGFGFGQRLANFRKLAGLSALELSNRVGATIATRSVIANMENGRVANVTLEKLFALAYALEVPPIALALPLDQPFARITLMDAHASHYPTGSGDAHEHEEVTIRVLDLIDWWGGSGTLGSGSSGLGNTVTRLILTGLRAYREVERTYLDAVSIDDAEQASRSLSAMNMHAANLKGYGVDMTGGDR